MIKRIHFFNVDAAPFSVQMIFLCTVCNCVAENIVSGLEKHADVEYDISFEVHPQNFPQIVISQI